MRKVIYIFFLLLSYTAYSQSLSVFNVDESGFPTIKANFFAFDENGVRITNLNPSHFNIAENGYLCKTTNITCPDSKSSIYLSSVLVIDVSMSMFPYGLPIAKSAANQWIKMLPEDNSECAITSFSWDNYLNQDFTSDKSKLTDAVNSLDYKSGTNYNAAFIDPMAGGVLVAKAGIYKRVIVFLTDGTSYDEPETDRIIKEAKENNITIYTVCFNMSAPDCLKEITTQTGGLYFERVWSLEDIIGCYSRIYMITQGVDPCTIEWLSRPNCKPGNVDVEIKLKINGIIKHTSYERPSKAIANLDVTPKIVKFMNVTPGIPTDTTITVTAINTDIYVSAIISSNPAFTVTPTDFILKNGESKDLTLTFTPLDRSYQFTEISITNDLCEVKFNAIGGQKSKDYVEKTLKLTQPNGKEIYVIGTDSLITWEGVFPEDTVKLEYSYNGGATWKLISEKATGLSYIWKNIPKPVSSICLVRVTADLKSLSQCEDGELMMYNRNWICENLNVTNYRNGDIIPQVTDFTAWKNLRTGAWCYYNNDPVMGEIYGKLYNYYAITDPRGLVPDGWHIPSNAEWNELTQDLGGAGIAGGKLKCIGTKERGDGLWRAPNKGATNESDFSALPGGYRNWEDNFMEIERASYWWSSTDYDATKAYFRYIYYNSSDLQTNYSNKNNGFSIRCISDKKYSFIQTDTSDVVFTITAPKADVKDIDIKQSLVGRAKDSVITDFIINTGKCKFRVDSIFIRCSDSCAFFLVSGFPKYEIMPGESHLAEFRFIPLRLGTYTAELVVITQSDTIVRKITGEGVKSVIAVQNKVINFGRVAVGYTRDTNQVITIKNVSDSKIHIVESKHNKPNDYDFTKGNGGGFDLYPHETKKMDLSFSPSAVGRTIGTLEFHYNGLGSPAVVQLYGIGVELIPQKLVSPGNDTINIPIDIGLYWNLNIGQTSYLLQVSLDDKFTNIVIDTAVSDTVFKCPKLDYFQTYYWRVKPGYQAKQSIWSPVWHFTTMMDSVKLLSPAGLSRNLDNYLDMNWEKGIYNKNYRLQISDGKEFKNSYIDSLIISNNFADIKNLKYYQDYIWRVRNESGDTLGYWSDIWQFKTRMSDILLIYPENTQIGLEKNIVFKWSNVIGAKYYQLQISKNDDFTNLVYSMDSLTNTKKYVVDLEPEVLYYWRVRVWNEECIGSEYWSEVWTFRTSPSGVNEYSDYITILPNPAGDYITIALKPYEGFKPSGGSEINIYNTLGEKVISVGTGRDQSVRINISTLQKGIYFVQVGGEFIKFIKL